MRYIPPGVLWNAAKKMDGRGLCSINKTHQTTICDLFCSVLFSSPLHLPAIDHITLRAQKSAKNGCGWGSLKLSSFTSCLHQVPQLLSMLSHSHTRNNTYEEEEKFVKPKASFFAVPSTSFLVFWIFYIIPTERPFKSLSRKAHQNVSYFSSNCGVYAQNNYTI